MSKVSIILPAYNVEQFIGECLISLVNQTFKDIEIIIVNDGSNDSTLKIIENWRGKDNRIEVINTHNYGAGSARNRGLRFAKSEYVIFIDPDDSCEETMIEELYSAIIKHDVDIAICNYYEVKEKGRIKMVVGGPYNKKILNKDEKNVLFNVNPTPWNKLFRRKLLIENNIKFPVDFRREDLFVISCSLMMANSIVCIEKPLYNYRVLRPGSATQANAKTLTDVLEILKLIKEYAISNNIYNYWFEEIEMISLKYGIMWYKISLNNCSFKNIRKYRYDYINFFRSNFNHFKSNKYYIEQNGSVSVQRKILDNFLFTKVGPYFIYLIYKLKKEIKRKKDL
ncbi:glycosyltransferase family 2 protein [Aureibacillus halotolerans]|uniref:Glycosyltransferase involved in cell wall biosynthesis n=1 Tax=Aureibacillus halotolerans TaxID=1508390 RepID=A0A4R6U2P0_9BACI|nr:glycosyltransferase family 2 protein [Aureibacillus halotolerans]TDQ38645.1 glycosyltransferase involved in cell wall biosynthesis [Aureibacillus halotolerans]